MNLINVMAGIPLFQGLPQQQLEELANIVVDQTFTKGQQFFFEGEEATG